jgi:outer membrane protein OmpA-like peptidoglycan-associated protein
MMMHITKVASCSLLVVTIVFAVLSCVSTKEPPPLPPPIPTPTPIAEPVREPPPEPSFEEQYTQLEKDIGIILDRIEDYDKDRDQVVERAKINRSLLAKNKGELETARDTTSEKFKIVDERIATQKNKLDEYKKQLEFYETLGNKEKIKEWGHFVDFEVAVRETLLNEQRSLKQDQVAVSQKLEDVSAELAEVQGMSDEQLFENEMKKVYMEGIEKYIEKYRFMMEATLRQVDPGMTREHVVSYYQDRIDFLSSITPDQMTRELFFEATAVFRRDKDFIYGVIKGYIMPIEFAVNSTRLNINRNTESELQRIVEYLISETYRDFMVYIDGHADSLSYGHVSACNSAARNKELSRLRAFRIRELLTKNGLSETRIEVDWYGNFSMTVPPRPNGEQENRRIEIRISVPEDGQPISHQSYFEMRHSLGINGRNLKHMNGRWTQEECREREPDTTLTYLDSKYQSLVHRLGLHQPLAINLEDENRQLLVSLGDDFVVMEDGRCIEVRPCQP